jgi:hypothetical protein
METLRKGIIFIHLISKSLQESMMLPILRIKGNFDLLLLRL